MDSKVSELAVSTAVPLAAQKAGPKVDPKGSMDVEWADTKAVHLAELRAELMAGPWGL